MDEESLLREIENVAKVLSALVGTNTKMDDGQYKAWNSIQSRYFPVYCCDEMKAAVNMGSITRDVFWFDGSILWQVGSTRINRCPFCGAELNHGGNNVRESAAK
jgi:hypothetical protein